MCVSTLSSECCKHVRVCVCARTHLWKGFKHLVCQVHLLVGKVTQKNTLREEEGEERGEGRGEGGGEGRGEGEEEGEGGGEEGEERVDSEGTLQKAIASNSVQLLSTN